MNCTQEFKDIEEKWMFKNIGPQSISLNHRITVGIIYSIIFISGILGNLCTCIVIVRNRYLHNSTNFYLFSLAVSDILLLLCGIPIELFQSFSYHYPWRLGSFICHTRTFFAEMSPVVSVLTITAFTAERYVAICHPLRAQVFSSFKRSIATIVIAWSIAMVFALPMSILTRPALTVTVPNITFPAMAVNDTNWPTDVAGVRLHLSNQCANENLWRSEDGFLVDSLLCDPPMQSAFLWVHFQVSAFVFFFIPLCVITLLYLLIGISLWRNDMSSCVSSSEKQSRAKKAVVRMLVAVVVAFFVCWAPFHFQRLMSTYYTQSGDHILYVYFQTILFYLSGSLFFVSSTLNPILYNVMSIKFRRAFMVTFFPCLSPPEAYPTNFRSDAATNGQELSTFRRKQRNISLPQYITAKAESSPLVEKKYRHVSCVENNHMTHPIDNWTVHNNEGSMGTLLSP